MTEPALGILGNDTDGNNDVLTAVRESGPSHGTLTLNPDGSFTYTLDTDFEGADSFTYHANDASADSNMATVTLTVTHTNEAPVQCIDEGQDVRAGLVVAGDLHRRAGEIGAVHVVDRHRHINDHSRIALAKIERGADRQLANKTGGSVTFSGAITANTVRRFL